MADEPFSGGSSVEALKWLNQYKKLAAKRSQGLSSLEQKTFDDLQQKLGGILQSEGNKPSKPVRNRQLRVDVKLEVKLATAAELQKSYIKNISGGGMYIETKTVLEPGTVFHLTLQLPGETQPMPVQVEVAWSNPKPLGNLAAGMGVKFVKLEPEHERKIQGLINQSLDNQLKKPRS